MTILAIAQHKAGKLAPVSLEVIEAAKSLGGELVTVVLAEQAGEMARQLAAAGGGKVLAVSHPTLKDFNDQIYGRVLGEVVRKHKPQVVLTAATNYGKAFMARLAAGHGGAMASDVTALSSGDGKVTATRPSYGGSVVAQVAANGDGPFFITLRPKIFNESKDGTGEVVEETVDASCFEAKSAVKEVVAQTSGEVTLADADVIVSAGRGIKGPENVDLVKQLANSMKAAFGASRAIVDAGWVEYRYQVGQTGRTVNPKLYFAIGISGAIQHLVGMQTSKTIVAVNKDKDAPIFNVATYGIVGDLFEIVPALTKKFQAEVGS